MLDQMTTSTPGIFALQIENGKPIRYWNTIEIRLLERVRVGMQSIGWMQGAYGVLEHKW